MLIFVILCILIIRLFIYFLTFPRSLSYIPSFSYSWMLNVEKGREDARVMADREIVGRGSYERVGGD